MKRLLWLLVALSLLPGLTLAVRRVQAEGRSQTVTVVMDELALAEQADYLGISSFELAQRYQALGLSGIAIYEETIASLAAKGKIVALLGSELRAAALARGEEPPPVPGDSTLVSEITPGALDWLLAKNTPEAQRFEVAGRRWYLYPGDGINTRPAGPDTEAISQFAAAGFDIAYRPRNFPGMRRVGEDFPSEARYLIHSGTQVAGYPDSLDAVIDASADYLTIIIEGTPQDGMPELAARVPTARLLSFDQNYINRRLTPQDLIDKYLLAANERGIRMLYLRPYTEEQLGNMFDNTEALITGLREALEREGYTVAPLTTEGLDYRANGWLRAGAAVGVLAGLGLLALLYPGVWGLLVAAAVLALGVFAGGPDWDALALAAALTFPVIGYGHFRERLTSLGLATAISLVGAVLLAAVGSDRETMLAVRPFAGVGATLVVPPALFLFHYALRFHRPAAWVQRLWSAPIRIGDVAVALLGLAALGLVFVRRGNFPIIGASTVELALRDLLADLFVRPRFKELLGHPLAVLALTNGGWPPLVNGLLLTAGVVAQATILNSFSHYHTPLLISLQRTLIALLLGLLLGLLLTPLSRLAVTGVRRWLASARPQEAPEA